MHNLTILSHPSHPPHNLTTPSHPTHNLTIVSSPKHNLTILTNPSTSIRNLTILSHPIHDLTILSHPLHSLTILNHPRHPIHNLTTLSHPMTRNKIHLLRGTDEIRDRDPADPKKTPLEWLCFAMQHGFQNFWVQIDGIGQKKTKKNKVYEENGGGACPRPGWHQFLSQTLVFCFCFFGLYHHFGRFLEVQL